jgi:hypothetical protein
MEKNVGRGEQYTGDLYVAQAGAACHIDLLDMKQAGKKTQLLANYKTCGIVSME